MHVWEPAWPKEPPNSTPPMRVQASAGGMRSQLGTYRDLRDNLSEGLRFYMSVQEAIAILRQQAGDYILTRRLQRCAPPPPPPFPRCVVCRDAVQ